MRILSPRLFWLELAFIFLFLAIAIQPIRAEAITSLFTTHRASRVGDTLTVVISEFSTASQIAKTNFGKDTETEGEMSLSGESYKSGWNYSSDFGGSGSTQRKGSLNAKITVEVVEVLPTGNLRVRGEKKLKINQEEEVIYLDGIVRPQDIGENNTILSSKIAQVSITYKGKGPVTEARRPGIFVRILNWLGIF